MSFKGKIYVKDLQRKKPLYQFELKTKDARIADTFMENFKALNLSDKEKRQLSQPIRKKLFAYQSLDSKEILQEAKCLVKKINSCKDSDIRIYAQEAGAYICLAALYSGKIKKDKHISLDISSVPLQLFPKNLIKNTEAMSHHHINVTTSSEKCWLKPFLSLQSCPKYLNIGLNNAYEEDTLLSYVA